ncbi:MAG TPA: DnaA regulatory inactivator Hda, partial [Gammaproteobacteria bacterium]
QLRRRLEQARLAKLPGRFRRGSLMLSQLALPLVVGRHNTFATFVTGANSVAVQHLRSRDTTGRRVCIWIAGRRGAGKSHLLQAAVAEAGSGATYLPIGEALSLGPGVLRGLGGLPFLALDDVDAAASSAQWEDALFGLFNEAQSTAGKLVIAARFPPTRSGFVLDDLASRFASAAVYRLEALDDELAFEALGRHARARGLELPDASARYLLTRVSRDMAEICAWLDELDGAALAAQRKLTIPFIRDAIAARA